MGALDAVVRAGKALYVGHQSTTTPSRPPQAAAILRELGTPLLIHQPSYSMLNRWIERDNLLDTLERGRRRLHRVQPAAQGLLTDRYLGGIPATPGCAPAVFLNESRPRRADHGHGLHALNDDRRAARGSRWPSSRWPGRCATRG